MVAVQHVVVVVMPVLIVVLLGLGVIFAVRVGVIEQDTIMLEIVLDSSAVLLIAVWLWERDKNSLQQKHVSFQD